MKLDVQTVNFSIREDLNQFIHDRVEKMKKIHQRLISTKIYLKAENSSSKDNKTTEIVLKVPGDEFIVKKTENSFEKGVDAGIEAAIRFLKRNKQKR